MVTKTKSKDLYCPKGMLAARLLLALIFVSSLIGKLTQFSYQASWAESSWLIAYIAIPGSFLIIIAILMELTGVVALISGWKMREGAIVLMAYTALATIMFHLPWMASPEMVQNETIALLKNLGLIGGLIALSMLPPGKFSIK
mgnify:CR=1 FL=1